MIQTDIEKEHQGTKGAEIGVMHPFFEQRMSRIASNQKLRTGQEVSSLIFRESMALPTPCFQTSSLRTMRE